MIARPPCPVPHDLERMLLGSMPDVEMDVLESHVSTCRHCLEVIRGLRIRDELVEAVCLVGKAGNVSRDQVDERLIARLCQLRPSLVTPLPSTSETVDSDREHEPKTARQLAGLLAPPVEPDELGRVGRYGILRILGSGGAGIVFAARDVRLGRVVALKMIVSGLPSEPHSLARFRAETEILAQLHHPNIVQVHEAGEHAGRPYFTMDQATGGTLAQKLAVAPLAARQAAELLQTLARAVHTAHERKIIHRDLKPSNVLLGSDGTALIGDFGLAKQFVDEPGEMEPTCRTETGTILGTPGYVAPEQISGQTGQIGPAVDTYALGAILYECMTGRPPFKAATILQTLEQARTQEPIPPGKLQPGLPRDLQTICLKCLERDPRRRYPSAQALADDLGCFLAGKPIAARPARTWERLGKWARRKPTAAALVILSVLALLALIVGISLHNARLQVAVHNAESNATEAREQQRRARGYYRQARETLDQMLEQFDRYRLGEVPQLKDLQRRQLEKALAFYLAALQDQDDPDPEIRLDAAIASRRAADVQLLLGQREAAANNYRRAIALLEGLPASDHETPETQRLLASCWNNCGLLANRGGEWELAKQNHLKAQSLLEELTRIYPDDALTRAGLAECEHLLGVVGQFTNQLLDAERHYERAATLYAALVRECPEVESHRVRMADNQVNLALIYQTSHREPQALAAYAQAETALRSLVERHPTAGEYKLSLAAVYLNWGIVLRYVGPATDGLARLSRAIELIEAVLKQEPNHQFARRLAFNAHGGRAQANEGLGRWADAVNDWDRVIALDNSPNPWSRKVLRAVALAHAGEYVRATTEAETLGKDPGADLEGLYSLATACAISADAGLKDQRLDSAEQATLANRYAARAVAFLRLLQSKGAFQGAEYLQSLTFDPDLRVLRERSDFKKLLMDVKQK